MAKAPKRRRQTMAGTPVLIVKPHNIQFQVDERVSIFIMKAFQRGVANYYPVATKLPEFGRNTAIKEFLNHPDMKRHSHIFFIDADTEPINERAIERLLSLDKDVVCGVTPVKIGTDATFEIGWNVQRKNEDGKHEFYGIDELPDKPFKIDRVGGTTVLIKRHVLERIFEEGEPFQKSVFNADITNVKLSEDYYFSEKLTKAGFTIWCDPLTQCHHYHNVDILDIMAVYTQAFEMGKQHGRK
jgi:hypothetical protein